METRIAALEERMIIVEADLKTKVSYELFFWVIGILMTIFIAVAGFISYQIKDLSATTTAQINSLAMTAIQTKEDVATIKGKLEPYSIEFKN